MARELGKTVSKFRTMYGLAVIAAGLVVSAHARAQDVANPPSDPVSDMRLQQAVPLPASTAPPALGPGEYRLDRGDKLRVRVYDREDLGWDVVVREDGTLQIPYLGKFDVRGRTTGEIEEMLSNTLRTRLNRDTSIAVDVLERRPIFIVGVVNKPGSYQFQPGMTVLHALAIAGGVLRTETSSYLAAEATRESARLQSSLEELKRLLANRARLVAERDGKSTIGPLSELSEIVGEAEAEASIAGEQLVLRRTRETTQREKDALKTAIDVSDKEIATVEAQQAQIKVQRALRDKQLAEAQGLMAKGLTTTQRVIDTQLAISLLERDALDASANIARARLNKQRASRDLDILTLDRHAKIEQELVRSDELIAKAKVAIRASRRVVEQITGLPASLQGPLGGDPILSYQILRQQQDGMRQTIAADEQTSIEPGDIVKFTPEPVRAGKSTSAGATN